MTRNCKLIAIDLDDTLLNNQHSLTQASQQAVEKALACGMQVVIASGRMFATTLPTVQALGLQTPVICYNGAMVRHPVTKEILLQESVSASLAAPVLEYARKQNMQLNAYLDDYVYSASENQWMRLYQTRTGAPYKILPNFYEEMADRDFIKMILIDAPETIEKLLPMFQEQFAGRLNVTRSNAEYMEFLPLHANKGSALAFVADLLGVPQSQTAAMGDSWNDLPMLQWAGIALAVENAKPPVKEAAERLFASNDSDGVAEALQWLCGQPLN